MCLGVLPAPTRDPPPMNRNAVEAVFMQYYNWGMTHIPQVFGPPLSIHEWRDRELARLRGA